MRKVDHKQWLNEPVGEIRHYILLLGLNKSPSRGSPHILSSAVTNGKWSITLHLNFPLQAIYMRSYITFTQYESTFVHHTHTHTQLTVSDDGLLQTTSHSLSSHFPCRSDVLGELYFLLDAA